MDNPVFKLEGVVHERSAEALQDFEGPLDLILFLLSKNKIEIQDIPIALHQQVEALEDHRDLAPRRAELRGGHRVQTLSVHDDLALRRALEHIDAAHERGFAGAAHADDAVDVAVWNGQGDVLERVYPSAGCFKGFA